MVPMTNETDEAVLEREESPDVPPGAPIELVRPLERRAIAGVATGLADYWGISPALTRVGFIGLAIFGGVGFVLYLAGWLLIPNDDGTESIAEEAIRRARSGESWVGVALIGLAAVVGLGSIAGVDNGVAWAVAIGAVGYLLYRGDIAGTPRPSDARSDGDATSSLVPPRMPRQRSPRPEREPRPPREPRPARSPRPPRERSILGRLVMAAAFLTMGILAIFDLNGAEIAAHHYVGSLLLIVASGLLVGTFAGRARWLIVPGLLLLPIAAVASVASWDGINIGSNSNVETTRVTVNSVSELASSYEFGVGDVRLDLSNLPADSTFDLDVSMEAGELRVFLPPETQDSDVTIDVGLGSVMVDVADDSPDITVDVGIGAIDSYIADRGGLGTSLNVDGADTSSLDVSVDLGIGLVTIRH